MAANASLEEVQVARSMSDRVEVGAKFCPGRVRRDSPHAADKARPLPPVKIYEYWPTISVLVEGLGELYIARASSCQEQLDRFMLIKGDSRTHTWCSPPDEEASRVSSGGLRRSLCTVHASSAINNDHQRVKRFAKANAIASSPPPLNWERETQKTTGEKRH